MSLKRWIATNLCPDLERAERRYWYLWHQVDTVNKWCDGEARDVTQYLLDQDRDHWRSLDAPPAARATPWAIQAFREWIYKKRTTALLAKEN